MLFRLIVYVSFLKIRTQTILTFVFLVDAGLGNLPYVSLYMYIYIYICSCAVCVYHACAHVVTSRLCRYDVVCISTSGMSMQLCTYYLTSAGSWTSQHITSCHIIACVYRQSDAHVYSTNTITTTADTHTQALQVQRSPRSPIRNTC